MTKYYILLDDKRIPGRWFLNGPTQLGGASVDPRTFTTGNAVDAGALGTLSIALRRRGRPLEFTLGDFDMPVVHGDLASALQEQCSGEIQLIPARVDGTADSYAVLNLTHRVQCLDEKNSGITLWTPDDGRPDKVGEYMIVAHPRIDGARVGGQRIFRIQGWENVIVVSEEIRPVFASKIGPLLQPA